MQVLSKGGLHFFPRKMCEMCQKLVRKSVKGKHQNERKYQSKQDILPGTNRYEQGKEQGQVHLRGVQQGNKRTSWQKRIPHYKCRCKQGVIP